MKKWLLIFFSIITYLFPTATLAYGSYLLINNPLLEQFNIYIIGGLSILVVIALLWLTLSIKKKSIKSQIGAIVFGLIVLHGAMLLI